MAISSCLISTWGAFGGNMMHEEIELWVGCNSWYMVILGALGWTTLSSAMIENVDEFVGVSKRLPKSVLEVSNLPLLFLTQTLMHNKTK